MTKGKEPGKKESKRQRRVAWLDRIGSVSVILFVLVLVFLSYNAFLHPPLSNQKSSLTAAIVDHLGLSQSNPTFIETCTSTLEKAGYTVDYYGGENVTVNFYRGLPSYGYDLIVLRVHSALQLDENKQLTDNCALFTSELYSQRKYVYEQAVGQVGIVKYPNDETLYFGIHPDFVRSRMNGRFNDTIVIMMGCNGLTGTQMAEAFSDEGAKAYIGWNKDISAHHTDQATITLLEHLVTERQTIRDAVEQTMNEIGSDPTYNSTLLYYPAEAGDRNS